MLNDFYKLVSCNWRKALTVKIMTTRPLVSLWYNSAMYLVWTRHKAEM